MDERRNADGSHTFTMNLDSSTPMRPVRDDVVDLVDAALGRLGGEVLHAMDPRRIVSFLGGGPPVWSVGMVDVPGETPYKLLVTYGLSHVLSPEDFRAPLRHEYSLAVPLGFPTSPWADALMRHQCRYVLEQGAEIRVNDCVPFRGVPMTRIPFQPAHHAMMPDSSLVGILCAADPVLPSIETPHGPIEVRRLVGVDSLELDRVETWSARGFLEELVKVNPLLLSPLQRGSAMSYPPFADAVNQRAAAEGSEMDAALFEFRWSAGAGGVEVELPTGQPAKRLLDAISARVGFGRRLGAISMTSPPIFFEPAMPPGAQPSARQLVIGGGIDSPSVAAICAALRAGTTRVRV